MRTILLAGASFLALCGSAHAQIPVTDVANAALNTAQVNNQLLEIAKWVQQLEAMREQYDQLVATYNVLSHATDIDGISNAIGGITRTLLPDADRVPGLMDGSTGMWGRAAEFLAQGHYHSAEIMGAKAIEMQRRELVTANARAMAAAGTVDAQEHLQKLADLQARLNAAEDVTEVSAVNGLILLEQQNLDAKRAQIENVRVMLAADDRVTQQRYEQMQSESADNLFAATARVSGGIQ
jgi:hypothetical protein